MSRLNRKTDSRRPSIEQRIANIEKTRLGLLELLEEGVEPKALKNKLLSLDHEERALTAELSELPELELINTKKSAVEYHSLLRSIIAEAAREDGILKKTEVRTAIRRLIEEVTVYPHNDSKGRDVELVGDIEYLIASNGFGMEAMVPRGGIEPPTAGFSAHGSFWTNTSHRLVQSLLSHSTTLMKARVARFRHPSRLRNTRQMPCFRSRSTLQSFCSESPLDLLKSMK